MNIYYDEDTHCYHTDYEEGLDFGKMTFIKKELISKASYEQLAPDDAEDFITVLAMLEQRETCLENVIEEWQNGHRFVCDIWMDGINSIAELFDALRQHSIYFRDETELDFYIKEMVEGCGFEPDEVDEEFDKTKHDMFDPHIGDYQLQKISFGGFGGFVSF